MFDEDVKRTIFTVLLILAMGIAIAEYIHFYDKRKKEEITCTTN